MNFERELSIIFRNFSLEIKGKFMLVLSLRFSSIFVFLKGGKSSGLIVFFIEERKDERFEGFFLDYVR